MTTVGRRLAIAVAAPVVCGTLLVLAWAGAEMLGLTPLSRVPANIAEAAATGNAAETLRLLQQGDNPTRVYPVRPDVISSEVTRVSALEAAIWSRQAELVALLDRHGAIGSVDVRLELLCLAHDLGADDIVEYFAAASDGCEPGAARARVVARSKGAAGLPALMSGMSAFTAAGDHAHRA